MEAVNPARLNRGADVFDGLIGFVLVLLLLTPVVMGAVASWAQSVVFVGAMLCVLLWALQGVRSGRLCLLKTWAWVFIALFFGVALVQLIPLHASVLKILSPETAATYARILPEGGAESRTLSLHPFGTRLAIMRLAALAMVFVVVAHTVRTRWQVSLILGALIAVALFEVMYGFSQRFSSAPMIFWNKRLMHLMAVTGTFQNKNHLAGLLEMILPLALAWLVVVLPRGRKAGPMKARFLQTLSTSDVHAPLFIAMAALIIALGVLFSLSRAGIMGMLLSLLVLAAFLGVSAGFRKYTLVLLLIVVVILIVSTVIGAELVVDRVEDVASGQSGSWAERLDLTRSGWTMLKTFPYWGTGLGSFRYAFERFQSPRFGDRIATRLHNDWLQLFCEMGVVGGVIVTLGLIGLILIIARTALKRKDRFCRWIPFGVLAGVAAMLLHSFFDYNLSMVTSNGLVFAVLLGVGYAVAHMPGKRHDSPEGRRYAALPLGPWPVRLALVPILAVAAVALCLWPARVAAANIAMNRHLVAKGADRPDPYFFLPVRPGHDARAAAAHLARARRLLPENPRYHYYYAGLLCDQAARILRDQAMESVRRLFGDRFDKVDSATLERVAVAIMGDLGKQGSRERLALLVNGQGALDEAIRLLPIAAPYHLRMAMLLATRAEVEAGLNGGSLDLTHARAVSRCAVWLASAKPCTLYEDAKIQLQQVIASADALDASDRMEDVAKQFRRAIYCDNAYTAKVYPLMAGTNGGPKALVAVTPRNLPAYYRLARMLWDEQQWETLLECLDEMDRLCELHTGIVDDRIWTFGDLEEPSASDTDDGASQEFFFGPAKGAHWQRTGSVLRMRLWVAQRRCTALGLLGRFRERAQAVTLCRDMLRQSLRPELNEVRALLHHHQHEMAEKKCRIILSKDWSNIEALLLATEIAIKLDRPSVPPFWENPFDQLYRLVI